MTVEEPPVAVPTAAAPPPADGKAEPIEAPASVPTASPSPAEVQSASEENTSENMDIEPPVEAVSHSSHPPIKNESSDIVSGAFSPS